MNSEFEAAWRRRFREFAVSHDDDARIAGWSEAGLQARLRNFLRCWRPTEKGGLWLDAGCGAGTYSRVVAMTGQEVIGLDYSEPSLARARQRPNQASISWLAGNVANLPISSGACDGAICFGVLQALSDPESAISELARVVRPGGQVWVDALNANCFPDAVRRALTRARGKQTRLRYDSPNHLQEVFRRNGFHKVQIVWIPIFPERLRILQPLFESGPMRTLLRILPRLGSTVSHAYVVSGER
jgi:ubiquinone/menaquinone biosynthesis C-methylase UbiE